MGCEADIWKAYTKCIEAKGPEHCPDELYFSFYSFPDEYTLFLGVTETKTKTETKTETETETESKNKTKAEAETETKAETETVIETETETDTDPCLSFVLCLNISDITVDYIMMS